MLEDTAEQAVVIDTTKVVYVQNVIKSIRNFLATMAAPTLMVHSTK